MATKRIRTDKQLHIRLTPEQYAKLEKIKDAAQFETTITDVARRLLIEAVDTRLLMRNADFRRKLKDEIANVR